MVGWLGERLPVVDWLGEGLPVVGWPSEGLPVVPEPEGMVTIIVVAVSPVVGVVHTQVAVVVGSEVGPPVGVLVGAASFGPRPNSILIVFTTL